MKKKKIPLIQWLISDDINDDTGVDLISIVADPAIEVKGVAFGKAQDVKFATDAAKQMIAGPVMIPNKEIYRSAVKGRPSGYEGKYDADMVRTASEKFFKVCTSRSLNLEHSDKMIPGLIVESWIIEHAEHDKSRMYGFDLPVGTWFIVVKIEDKDYWEGLVKSGMTSFSVEGLMYEMPIRQSAEVESWINELDKDTVNQMIDGMTKEELIEALSDLIN